jgi:NDP-sugar pyrophosphorylase family protein
MNEEKQAVILAGGLGTRLRPFTEAIPKPLLPIGEKSIIEIQILRLKKFGFTEIFIATNYKSDYIESFLGNGERFGLKIFVNKEPKPLGTCGPLSLLKDRLKDRFLVMNGDILTNIDFNKLFDHARNLNTDFVVVTKELIMPFAFGKIYSNNHYITGVEEKPNIKNEIIAGLYVMNKGVFRYIPPNKYFGMDNLIKKMLKHNSSIGKYLMHELWLDIGQLPDYEKAQKIYEKHFKEE